MENEKFVCGRENYKPFPNHQCFDRNYQRTKENKKRIFVEWKQAQN